MSTGSPKQASANRAAACDQRCLCGSLIARLVDGGVEIKCRRCQRIVRLPLARQAATAGERVPP